MPTCLAATELIQKPALMPVSLGTLSVLKSIFHLLRSQAEAETNPGLACVSKTAVILHSSEVEMNYNGKSKKKAKRAKGIRLQSGKYCSA
jgi:hypothetical protein